jgi:hypothetical protein
MAGLEGCLVSDCTAKAVGHAHAAWQDKQPGEVIRHLRARIRHALRVLGFDLADATVLRLPLGFV